VRDHKACYPCRQRKVKCDLERPCRTCSERGHPQLCDYKLSSTKRQRRSTSGELGPSLEAAPSTAANDTVTLSHGDFDRLCAKLQSVENTLEDLRREIKHNANTNSHGNTSVTRTPQISGRSSPNALAGSNRGDYRHTTLHGIHTRNDLTGQTVHLGGSSVPALVMALRQSNGDEVNVQNILGKSILPLFGLDDETATYPFVSLWELANGSLVKAQQLAKTIPVDSQCLSFFHYYRDLGHVIYPGVADPAAFEHDLTTFLRGRTAYRDLENNDDLPGLIGVTEQSMYDKDYTRIGLLFAVLASGCQCSSLPRKERELTSQVYSERFTSVVYRCLTDHETQSVAALSACVLPTSFLTRQSRLCRHCLFWAM